MNQHELTRIVEDTLKQQGKAFPSFIVVEDPEPDVIASGGYPFHVVFTDGSRFTVLARPGDLEGDIRERVVRDIA